MKKIMFIFVVIAAAVFSCWANEGYDDLAKLVKAGVGDEVIIAYINTSKGCCALTPDDVRQLKAMGASDKVIAAATRQPGSGSGSGDTVIVNIPNENEGYTAVKLVRVKNGYIGPQGELYEGHPTVKQLRALYGK
jgi:hypothetical protein